jgi:hypothetical protein
MPLKKPAPNYYTERGLNPIGQSPYSLSKPTIAIILAAIIGAAYMVYKKN